MNIYIKLKSVSKRHPVLESTPYTLPEGISSLRHLIEALVRQEVEKFNSRRTENMLVSFLTDAQISDQSTVGKIGFGRIYSDKKADVGRAVETAIQAFEDGLFRVMICDIEAVELDEPLTIHENDTLTLIRLTFLSGRLW